MEIIKQSEELIVLIKEQPQEKGIATVKILADKARKLIEEAKKSPKQDDQFKSLLNQLENIIKQMEEKSNQGAHHLCKKAWDKLLTIFEAFKVYVQNQEERFQKQDERLKQVEEKLEDKEEKLALGQVVWIFEQAVAKYVLPEGTKITRFGALNQMTNWLYKDNKKDKITGREKWLKLREIVNWNENHPKLIETLKERRHKIAHENINLEKAKTQAKDNLSDDQYGYFLDIVRIIEKTRETGCDSSSVPSRRRREAPPAGSTSKKRKI